MTRKWRGVETRVGQKVRIFWKLRRQLKWRRFLIRRNCWQEKLRKVWHYTGGVRGEARKNGWGEGQMDREHDCNNFFWGDVRWQISELGVLRIFCWMYTKKNTTCMMKSLCMKIVIYFA